MANPTTVMNPASRTSVGLIANRPSAATKSGRLGDEFTAIDRLYSAMLVRDPNSLSVKMWMPNGSTGVRTATAGTAVANKLCINAAGTINLLALTTTDQPNYGVALTTTTWISQGVGNVITAAVAITSGGYLMTDGAGLATPFVAGGGALRQGLALGDGVAAGGGQIPVLLYRDAII